MDNRGCFNCLWKRQERECEDCIKAREKYEKLKKNYPANYDEQDVKMRAERGKKK